MLMPTMAATLATLLLWLLPLLCPPSMEVPSTDSPMAVSTGTTTARGPLMPILTTTTATPTMAMVSTTATLLPTMATMATSATTDTPTCTTATDTDTITNLLIFVKN